MNQWEVARAPDTSTTLTGLKIFTVYTVSVAAQTVAGVGPYDTPVQVQTLSDSEFNTQSSRLNKAYMCVSVQPAVSQLK